MTELLRQACLEVASVAHDLNNKGHGAAASGAPRLIRLTAYLCEQMEDAIATFRAALAETEEAPNG